MTRRPILFWLCIAYLLSTISYNVWKDWQAFAFFAFDLQAAIAANLALKLLAVPLLLFRRMEGVYLLAMSFVIGTGFTMWDFWRFGGWDTLPLLNRIGTANGIFISLACLTYLAVYLRMPKNSQITN